MGLHLSEATKGFTGAEKSAEKEEKRVHEEHKEERTKRVALSQPPLHDTSDDEGCEKNKIVRNSVVHTFKSRNKPHGALRMHEEDKTVYHADTLEGTNDVS